MHTQPAVFNDTYCSTGSDLLEGLFQPTSSKAHLYLQFNTIFPDIALTLPPHNRFCRQDVVALTERLANIFIPGRLMD
jgi:hypothetical protein